MPSALNQPRPRDRDMSLTGIPYAPTRFVQLLTPRRASAYLRNATEGGFSRAYVQGFFVQEEALAQCLTASAVLGVMDVGWLSERGRLASFRGPLPDASDQLSPGTVATCSGSGASCVYVLCFDVASDLEATLTHQDPPGHSPASGAWWHSGEPMAILPGARIEAIDEDGHRRVLAHWNAETNGLWHWGGLGEPGSFSTLATIFERTFSRGRGWVPIRPLDSRRGLVHAADRRILRFLLGDALIQSGAGVAAWGIVDLAAADTLVCTTHVSYWGVVGVLTGFHPDGAGNTLASLTAHVPWSPAVEQAGMWGDEMGGFHADIPLEETGPSLTSPSWPLRARPPPRWRSFLSLGEPRARNAGMGISLSSPRERALPSSLRRMGGSTPRHRILARLGCSSRVHPRMSVVPDRTCGWTSPIRAVSSSKRPPPDRSSASSASPRPSSESRVTNGITTRLRWCAASRRRRARLTGPRRRS